MKFNEFGNILKRYEERSDIALPSGGILVARLDGRGFTKLTKQTRNFAKPFDSEFHELMLLTTEHVMRCGPKTIYGYVQSDEISILLHPSDDFFNRRLQKLCSVLAGEASGIFSVNLGMQASFDCRISQLPDMHRVRDYFRWRQEDARRNALNAHCYWTLNANGIALEDIDNQLKGMSYKDKKSLLLAHDIDFEEIPLWQKNGSGVYWGNVQVEGVNKKTGEPALAYRSKLTRDLCLPDGDAYGKMVLDIMSSIN